eukprot:172214-Chlamydomonas_euryale.AAC.4
MPPACMLKRMHAPRCPTQRHPGLPWSSSLKRDSRAVRNDPNSRPSHSRPPASSDCKIMDSVGPWIEADLIVKGSILPETLRFRLRRQGVSRTDVVARRKHECLCEGVAGHGAAGQTWSPPAVHACSCEHRNAAGEFMSRGPHTSPTPTPARHLRASRPQPARDRPGGNGAHAWNRCTQSRSRAGARQLGCVRTCVTRVSCLSAPSRPHAPRIPSTERRAAPQQHDPRPPARCPN